MVDENTSLVFLNQIIQIFVIFMIMNNRDQIKLEYDDKRLNIRIFYAYLSLVSMVYKLEQK